MSHSIFSSALGRAILRRPPSAPLLVRLTSTFARHGQGPRESISRTRTAAHGTAITAIDALIDTTAITAASAIDTLIDTTATTTSTTNYNTNTPPTTAEHQCLPRRRKPPSTPTPETYHHHRPKTLLALLHLLDRAHDIPARHRPGKVDLSFHDPLSRVRVRRRTPRQQQRKGRVSLKSITYEYLYHFHLLPPGGEGVEAEKAEKVFSGRVLGYLAERGYTAEDVVVWAWILLAGDVRRAVVRLDVWARLDDNNDSREQTLKGAIRAIIDCASFNPLDTDQAQGITRRSLRIPPFIILHNLRRPHGHISAHTLRQLLPHVQLSLLPHSGDTKTPLLLLIRLLRHARSSWPPAIPHVAELMANLHSSADRAPKRSARLTGTYNRLLALLSLPTHDRPFQCMPLLQQSQFTLLRKMASLDIPITREGYRSLIAVQLSHPKTPPEAQHVNSLSTTWPPYPVPKDGHRHSPGHPSSPPHLSRAATVLQQMTAAGYHNLGWEKEALVLAGTDTDATPTIQTRTFHLAGRASARPEPRNIWAVRVRATRTLDEAWCVFLDCLDAVGVPPPPAWEELFYKVCAARKVARQREGHQRRLQEIQAGHDASRAEPTAATLRAVERWGVVEREMGERAVRVLPGDAREVAGLEGRAGVGRGCMCR
ncbi:uncharacterized protein LAJ45_04174 [Morchella importuna]|uniref:uncharacterized protein n=1 Tax=Morchella importuna TaxID=1174673 RepID=UPI001E8E07D7|nr:uncharacterized protein LAJ45_04174 [Morchella importuna]KAH8151553.1 hypothetical protein LAJ45_04174 [Morchella importuna]